MRFINLLDFISFGSKPTLIILLLITVQISFVITQSQNAKDFTKKSGSVQILGVFPNTLQMNFKTSRCFNYSLQGIQLTQAMIYAIDQLVNNNPQLLPGIKMGWILVDSCSSKLAAMVSVTSILVTSIVDLFPRTSSQIQQMSTNNSQNNNANPLNNSTNRNPTNIGIIAAKNEDITTALASFTSSLFYPQISYNSYNQLLSDRKLFPFLYRTTPLLHVQAKAIVDIVSHFNWNWISVVIAGSNYASNMQSTISTITRNLNICISLNIVLYDNYTQSDLTQAMSQLKHQHRSNTIILVGEESIVYNFLLAAQVGNLTGKTFIGTYSWINSPNLQHISGDILAGALGIDIDRKWLNQFSTYLRNLDLCNNVDNPWFIEAWYHKLISAGYDAISIHYYCHLDRQLQDNLFSSFYEVSYISAFVMDAVLALAHALHDSLGCNSSYCPPFSANDISQSYFDFTTFLYKVSFKGISSNVFRFRSDGSSQLQYQVINLQPHTNTKVKTFKTTTIGYWNESDRLSIESTKIRWNGGNEWYKTPLSRCSDDCQPGYFKNINLTTTPEMQRCCWECKMCQKGAVSDSINQHQCKKCVNFTQPNINRTQCHLVQTVKLEWTGGFMITFWIITGLLCLYLILVWITIIKYRATPVIKGSNFVLMNIYLFFILTILMSACLYVMPITDTLCYLTAFMESTGVIGLISTILCKTNQIAMIFKSTFHGGGNRSKLIRNSSQILIIVVIELIFHGIYLGLIIYEPIHTLRHLNKNNQIELTCFMGKSAIIAFFATLAILSIITLVTASRTRNLPDNFSEARHIFLAALMLVALCASSIPTYYISNGINQQVIISILTICYGAIGLICLLSPKMYVIYFRSELNTRQQAVASVTNFTFNTTQLKASSVSAKLNKTTESPIAIGQKVIKTPLRQNTFSQDVDDDL